MTKTTQRLEAANEDTIRGGARMSRHPDLQPLLQTLGWFYAALESVPTPLGTAANDNDRPPSVPDVNPAPPKAEDLLNALGAPTRVYTTVVRRGGRQVAEPRRMAEWRRSTGPQPPKWGAVRFATEPRRVLQFVRVNGELAPRVYSQPRGAITHIWGQRVGQDIGRTRRSESKAAIAQANASMLWFCETLRAVPPQRPRKTFRRRSAAPPIDWTKFSHVRGNVPLAEALAACELPPADRCALPGLPYEPDPALLFAGLVSGRGSRKDGAKTESRVRRPDPDAYIGDSAIVDRITLEQFEVAEPDHYATLVSARFARSMGDLVASNDNKTGKRRFALAAEALQKFRAA